MSLMNRPIKFPRFQNSQPAIFKAKPVPQTRLTQTPKPKGNTVSSALQNIVKRRERVKTQTYTMGKSPPTELNHNPEAFSAAVVTSSPKSRPKTQQQYLSIVDDLKSRVGMYEKEFRAKMEFVKELEKKDEQRQIQFENQVKKLTGDKKRTQETLVKRNIEVENLKLKVEQAEQEIEKAKDNIRQQYEGQLEDLKYVNGQLTKQVNQGRLEEMAVRNELDHLKELYNEKEIQQIQTTGLEKVLMDRVEELQEIVHEYSKSVMSVDRSTKSRLEEKQRLLERYSKQLIDAQKKKFQSSSQRQLRKTITKYQSTQNFSTQLKSNNSHLSKQNKQLEAKLAQNNRRLELMTCKLNNTVSENKALKQQLIDVEKKHIQEMQKKNEQSEKMKKTIGDIGGRLEKCVRAETSTDYSIKERHLMDMVDKYQQEVNTLTAKLARAQATVQELRSGSRIESGQSERLKARMQLDVVNAAKQGQSD